MKLIKNRSDIGAGTRGADLGIDAIEIAAINANNDYFIRFPYSDVPTHNETVYDKVKAPFAKRITHVREQCNRLAGMVRYTLSEGFFPIVLSGDHSSALGTISGIKAMYPEKTLGVIWVDAHADLHSPYTSPSGNVHGMPLAAALGEDNQEARVNEVSENTLTEWENLKNTGIPGPKLRPEHLVFFGVRDTEEPEDLLIRKHGIRNYMVHEVRYRGMETCIAETLETLEDCDMIYISFDVDSLDCDLVSYGTGTPVPKGFDPAEAVAIINGLFDSKKVVCMEVTEVNPLLDHKGNKMGETAFEVLDSVTSHYLSLG
ncbi:MAG: arginase [Bacteroidetes bacterium]|nr:arginase [Bacteroidota bacterium]